MTVSGIRNCIRSPAPEALTFGTPGSSLNSFTTVARENFHREAMAATV